MHDAVLVRLIERVGNLNRDGQGLVTVGFTGAKGESMRALCDHLLIAPSDEAGIIQQVHMVAAHAICGQIEQVLMNKAKA